MQQTTLNTYPQYIEHFEKGKYNYWVRIIVKNVEIACYERFFHLPQSFQKPSAAEGSENTYIWENVTWSRDQEILKSFSMLLN